MTRDPVHMGKTFQVAAANRNGVTAALLARQVFRAVDILDGTHGLFDAYLNNPEAGAGLLTTWGAITRSPTSGTSVIRRNAQSNLFAGIVPLAPGQPHRAGPDSAD
jgi:hypothetical protein